MRVFAKDVSGQKLDRGFESRPLRWSGCLPPAALGGVEPLGAVDALLAAGQVGRHAGHREVGDSRPAEQLHRHHGAGQRRIGGAGEHGHEAEGANRGQDGRPPFLERLAGDERSISPNSTQSAGGRDGMVRSATLENSCGDGAGLFRRSRHKTDGVRDPFLKPGAIVRWLESRNRAAPDFGGNEMFDWGSLLQYARDL